MLGFKTSKSNAEVSITNLWKITSFSKATLLQRKPFLTMFYTINSSPLLVTMSGFMLIIILSTGNYQQCPLPLTLSTNLGVSMELGELFTGLDIVMWNECPGQIQSVYKNIYMGRKLHGSTEDLQTNHVYSILCRDLFPSLV